MNMLLLQDLVDHRAALREAWLAELPCSSSGADSASRVDAALDELIATLRFQPLPPIAAVPPGRRGRCPERALEEFYLAAERALLPMALALGRAGPAAAGTGASFDLAELYTVLRHMARRDITALCRQCAHCRKLVYSHPAASAVLSDSQLNLAAPA